MQASRSTPDRPAPWHLVWLSPPGLQQEPNADTKMKLKAEALAARQWLLSPNDLAKLLSSWSHCCWPQWLHPYLNKRRVQSRAIHPLQPLKRAFTCTDLQQVSRQWLINSPDLTDFSVIGFILPAPNTTLLLPSSFDLHNYSSDLSIPKQRVWVNIGTTPLAAVRLLYAHVAQLTNYLERLQIWEMGHQDPTLAIRQDILVFFTLHYTCT